MSTTIQTEQKSNTAQSKEAKKVRKMYEDTIDVHTTEYYI